MWQTENHNCSPLLDPPSPHKEHVPLIHCSLLLSNSFWRLLFFGEIYFILYHIMWLSQYTKFKYNDGAKA
jgi:hypothetical protein